MDKHLFLGDEADIEAIEKKHGCKMEEMHEGDLLDVLAEHGIEAETAKYDGVDWIEYA